METPPIHVLLALDAQILGGKVGYGTSTPSSPVVSITGHDDDDDDNRSLSGDATIEYDSGDETATYVGEGGARTASSRFWGVTWDRGRKKWLARYRDADGKRRRLGRFDDEEEAARA